MRKVYLLYLTCSFLYHITASFPVATDLQVAYSMKKMDWRIPQISCVTDNRINIRSDLFKSFNSKYYLTYSSDDKNLFIDVTRDRDGPDDIHVSLSLMGDDGTEVALTFSSLRAYKERDTIRYLIDPSKYSNCLEIESKGEKIAPSKMMTATLLTWKYEWDRGMSTLQKNIDLDLTGKNPDITFKVGHDIIKAHRNILRARAPAFSDAFEKKEKKNSNDSIVISDIFSCSSPENFKEFLRYIYTGNVRNLTPKRAISLYEAAEKYKISDLKGMCVEYLEVSLSTSDVCGVISLATEYNELNLLQKAESFFLKHAEEIMRTTDWSLFLKHHPTQAHKLWLKIMKNIEQEK